MVADGSTIAFHSQHLFDPGLRYQIYAITVEGENLEKLTEEGSNRFPAYSPDGTKIAFASPLRRIIFCDGYDGSNPVKLTNTPPGVINTRPSWLFAAGAFAVSPNGKRHLGENSNAPATRDDVNELGADT